MTEFDADHCSEEMKTFFRDYLEDISDLILKIKSNVYEIVNIKTNRFINESVKVKANISSIFSHCKRTFDDLKRISSILSGYVLGRQKSIGRQNYIESQKNYFDKKQSRIIHNNFTFQDGLRNSSQSSSQTEEIYHDSLTYNTENDRRKSYLKKKQNFRNYPYVELFHSQKQGSQKHNKEKERQNSWKLKFSLTKNSSERFFNRNSLQESESNALKLQNRQNRVKTMNDLQTHLERPQINFGDRRQRSQNEDFKRKNRVNEVLTRKSKVVDQILIGNSQCINLIRSIRKQLSK